MKMSYNRMYSDNKSQYYSHLYKWNPDGRSNYFNTRIGNLFRMDLSLSQSTFANIMLSQSTNHYRNHLSDDPEFYKELDFEFSDEGGGWFSNRPELDSNIYYVNPTIYDYTPVNNYYAGGHSMGAYNRKSVVNTFKAELTRQLNAKNQFKTGFEYRVTNITLTDIEVQLSDYTDMAPTYQNPLYSPTNDSYGKD